MPKRADHSAGHPKLGFREFLYANTYCVEGIRAIRTVLEFVFFCLSKFLSTFILFTIINACSLNREQKIAVVVPVDEHLMQGAAL